MESRTKSKQTLCSMVSLSLQRCRNDHAPNSPSHHREGGLRCTHARHLTLFVARGFRSVHFYPAAFPSRTTAFWSSLFSGFPVHFQDSAVFVISPTVSLTVLSIQLHFRRSISCKFSFFGLIFSELRCA